MVTAEEIKARVTYHPPTPEAIRRHDKVRRNIGHAMEELSLAVPAGREASIVQTKLEEAMFWANAGIARNHGKL